MAKFKNIHSKTGKITFNGARIEFKDYLETDNKSLIDHLEASSNWLSLEEKGKSKANNDELETLREEARELKIKGANLMGEKKLIEAIAKSKAEKDL